MSLLACTAKRALGRTGAGALAVNVAPGMVTGSGLYETRRYASRKRWLGKKNRESFFPLALLLI